MAKKSTKSPVKDFKPKRVAKPQVKKYPKNVAFEKCVLDPLLLGILISGANTKEKAEDLAKKIIASQNQRMSNHGYVQWQKGRESGVQEVKDSLRSLIGAAAEDHSHSIS